MLASESVGLTSQRLIQNLESPHANTIMACGLYGRRACTHPPTHSLKIQALNHGRSL